MHHSDALFHPSFLVAPEKVICSLQDVCANCGERDNRLKKCDRCRSVAYCSRECQVADWPKHRVVCGKTSEVLRGHGEVPANAAGCESRPSVVMSIQAPKQPKSSGNITRSMNISFSGVCTRETKPGKAARNIHGHSEFVVKVQVPPDGGWRPGDSSLQSTGCQVYDKVRSFNAYIPIATTGLDRLVTLVRAQGYMTLSGLGKKGYFLARREAKNLRIFIDTIQAQPKW